MIVYGTNAVREALRGRRAVERLWTLPEHMDRDWLMRARAAGVDVRMSDARTLTELCDSTEHQGVVARTAPFPYSDLERIAGSAAGGGRDGAARRWLVIALDGVTDPQNLGAVARVAECVGAAGIVLPERRSARVTPAVCRASAGAVEHLQIALVANMARAMRDLKGRGAWIYGASHRASASYLEPDYGGQVVIVMGSEGRGLRPGVERACDQLVRIPLAGRVESLNVSAACAVIAYEVLRQRG